MIPLKLKMIADHLGGELTGSPELVIDKIETDSRKNVKDALFVALKGERFDAHDFIKDIAAAGAAAVVVDHRCDVDIPQIVVSDTGRALGLIGNLNRRQGHAKVVSMTGTCGKTSVKEMTAAILKTMGKTIATQGNFNNAVGVPLSLLQIDEDTDFAVIELGANHPGEINYIVNLAEPDAVAINNVGSAHLEGFGSLDGVYRAKSEILDFAVTHGGVGVVNADNDYYANWKSEYGEKLKLTGFSADGREDASFKAENIRLQDNGCFSFVMVTPFGSADIELGVPGKHNVANALCAAALTSLIGAKLENMVKGLSSVVPSRGRLFVEKLGRVTLIDDAYNASVNAVNASVDTLALFPGRKVFVFGDMGELGSGARDLHASIGNYASGKIDFLLSVGDLASESSAAFGENGIHFSDKEQLKCKIKEFLDDGETCTIAVKGAHFMHMEKIVDFVRSCCGGNKC